MKRNEFLKRILGAGAAAIAGKTIVNNGKELPDYNKDSRAPTSSAVKEVVITDKEEDTRFQCSGICSYKCSG
jgi:anaerobic selenocysteine-containing dehydrogenase